VRPPLQDPTAGRRARAIREDPGAPELIRDPTDPRCGELSDPGAPELIRDPTDPRCGELSPDPREQAEDRPRIFDPTDPEPGAAA
jgi:hypothetical protein